MERRPAALLCGAKPHNGRRAVLTLLDGLPTAIPDLVKVVQGLIIHPVAVERHGLALDEATPEEVRFVPDMLQHIVDRSSAPLLTARERSRRLQRVAAVQLDDLRHRHFGCKAQSLQVGAHDRALQIDDPPRMVEITLSTAALSS